MIRFDTICSHKGLGHSACEANSKMTSGIQSRGSVSVKLDFDDETPRQGPVVSDPRVLFSNLFLKKERKNLSDSTPSRKSKEIPVVESNAGILGTFKKNLNECAELQNPTNTGSFLPKFGSSESIQLDNENNRQKDEKDTSKTTISSVDNEEFFENTLSSNSFISKFKPYRSFSENCHKTLPQLQLKQHQNSFEDTLKFELSSPIKLTLATNKNINDPDLSTISTQTLANLIAEKPSSKYLIVDCRFNYEYTGGHIKNAINIVSLETFEKVFFQYKNLLCNPQYVEDLKKDMSSTLSNAESYSVSSQEQSSKKPLIIFHCEFSQKRGPRAFRALRKKDREVNCKNWPHLDFPEIYMLEEGYCAFYSKFPEHCEGGYIRMVDKAFKLEYAQAKEQDKILWGKKYVLNYH